MEIVLSTASQIESVLKQEVERLGYVPSAFNSGRTTIEGEWIDLARTNVSLRTADRVYIRLARFTARTFDELFDGIMSARLKDLLPKTAKIHMTAKCKNSQLMAFSACQSVANKAVCENLKRAYGVNHLPMAGATFDIELNIQDDIAELLLNTSGEGLYKRGYRDLSTEAPIKETLAAGLLLLAKRGEEDFCDPFAGSGTLAIEYARIAKNIAPGINRSFAFESLGLPEAEKALSLARDEARSQEKPTKVKIIANDINQRLNSIIARHAKRAGVIDCVTVRTGDARKIVLPDTGGLIVTNPPYGERLMTVAEVGKLYRDFGENMKRNNPNWRVNVVTAYENFEKAYGKRAVKNRKIYNARLACRYYMF